MIAAAPTDGVRNVDQVVPPISRQNSNPKRRDPGERKRRDPKDEPESEPSDADDDPTTPHIDIRV